MTAWVENIHRKAYLVHEQIMALKEAQKISGIDTSGTAKTYWALLEKLYTEDMPFARLLDTSDIVLHAEGPHVHDALPTLQAFNWLCHTAEKQLKHLAKATFDLSEQDAKRMARQVDLRLTGIAPGSVYAGFKLQPPDSDLIEGETEPVFYRIKDAITKLPEIPGFIGDESINGDIREAIPDSAIRDAMLNAALHIAPSGRMGIHTVEISSPSTHKPGAELSQRERVVIREALKRPKLASPKEGVFVGEIREVDLDAKRFHLRNIKDYGTLRCVLPEHFQEQAYKAILGDTARVSGYYEPDKSGKPRLLLVDKLELMSKPVQTEWK